MSSAFRDGLRKLADSPPASKVISTRFGDVIVRAPLAARVDEFRKALGDKAVETLQTQGALVALACVDPETGQFCFTADDIEWLNKIAAGAFNAINEAVAEVTKALSLDPPTTGTGIGSGSVSDSECQPPDSAKN